MGAKDIGYTKTHKILKHDGTLALFWNSSHSADWNDDTRSGLDEVYALYFPSGDSAKERKSIQSQIDENISEITNTDLFDEIEARTYPWYQWYPTEHYIHLLDTYSENRVMDDSKRLNFFDEVRNVLDRNGGGMNMPYQALLFLARRK